MQQTQAEIIRKQQNYCLSDDSSARRPIQYFVDMCRAKKTLALLLLLMAATCLKLQLTLQPEQMRCFYQLMLAGQKYAVQVSPLQPGTFELSIKHEMNSTWLHSVHRQTDQPSESVSLFKLAKHEGLYSFCIRNSQRSSLKLAVEIRWGLQLLDLKVVAEEDDQAVIERESKWIEKQVDKIVEAVEASFVKRRDRDELANLMRKKLIGFAIVGLLVLLAISGFFYLSLRKTFRERKMI